MLIQENSIIQENFAMGLNAMGLLVMLGLAYAI